MSIAPALSMNRILAALPMDDFQRVASHLHARTFQPNDYLIRHAERVDSVFFPHQGVCSVVTAKPGGQGIESELVGCEGIVGYWGGRDIVISASEVIAQSPPTTGAMMDHRAFLQEMDRGGRFAQMIDGYIERSVRSSTCNPVHTNEARCARWLLSVSDRMGGRFELQHDFLATMLGVSNSVATAMADQFQQAGQIQYRQDHVAILDRPGLERTACDCYLGASPVRPPTISARVSSRSVLISTILPAIRALRGNRGSSEPALG